MNAPEVAGQGLAQGGGTAWIGIAHGVDRCLAPGGAKRSQPAVPRKPRKVGQAGVKVIVEARSSERGRAGAGRRANRAATRTGAPWLICR